MPDTVLGAFIRDMEAQIAEAEAADVGDAAAAEAAAEAEAEAGTDGAATADRAGELRDALRLGRLLLAGEEVTL
jgi:hypothetical protein